MKRIAVRFVAAALAVGFTLLELNGIALIAEGAVWPGDPVLVLPRLVITPVASAPARKEPETALAREASLPPT